jgi:hypothetical protein
MPRTSASTTTLASFSAEPSSLDSMNLEPVTVGPSRGITWPWLRTVQATSPARRCSPALTSVTRVSELSSEPLTSATPSCAIPSGRTPTSPTVRFRTTPARPPVWSSWKWVSRT